MRLVDGVDGRLWVTIRLRDKFGAERLMLGDGLRTLLRLVWILDRDGLLMRGLACHLGVAERCGILLRVGMDRRGVGVDRCGVGVDRCGVGMARRGVGMDRCGVGRAIGLELDRLGAGADGVVRLLLCCLDCTRLRLLLRALRCEFWASAASASNMTKAVIPATWAVLPFNKYFFTRNIM